MCARYGAAARAHSLAERMPPGRKAPTSPLWSNASSPRTAGRPRLHAGQPVRPRADWTAPPPVLPCQDGRCVSSAAAAWPQSGSRATSSTTGSSRSRCSVPSSGRLPAPSREPHRQAYGPAGLGWTSSNPRRIRPPVTRYSQVVGVRVGESAQVMVPRRLTSLLLLTAPEVYVRGPRHGMPSTPRPHRRAGGPPPAVRARSDPVR
jgi:hypothetical protein